MIRRAVCLLHLEWPPRNPLPTAARLVVASVVAVAGSLAADALLVRAGVALFPRTRSYQHFQFGDYATLTVIGVVIACVAWPLVTQVCSTPRWLFLRLAVLVTLVLLLPDVYLLQQGQPKHAVTVLMVMHVAIALVTYTALVRIAPVGDRAARRLSRT